MPAGLEILIRLHTHIFMGMETTRFPRKREALDGPGLPMI